MNNLKKISLLKTLLNKERVDGYLIASYDEFQNEHPPECLQRLKWLTNFSGSNGLALVTTNKCYFFTDGRYLIQAQNQLVDDFTVFDLQNIDNIYSEVFQGIRNQYVIGYDPMIFTRASLDWLQNKYIKNNKYVKMISLECNLIDNLWKRDKQCNTEAPLILNTKCTSESANQKIKKLLSKFETDYLLLTSPQSICWLLNMRGNDLIHEPLIMGYCIVSSQGEIAIYSGLQKIKLNYNNVKLYPFCSIKERILDIDRKNHSIQLDYFKTPIWFVTYFQEKNIVRSEDPCALPKSIKNDVEIAGFQYAMIQDGIALTKLFCWLEESINTKQEITEIDVDKQLLAFKKHNKLFKSKSFETISAYSENSAIIHYNPYCGKNLNIGINNFYLLDCGSQYTFGTTDITRTFHFDDPTEEQQLHYTLVLKGLINLSNLIFPKKTSGAQIDVIARQFLWNHCLDFPHGTGHGVGHYLSVHEGPQGINKFNHQELCKNMVITIEPGYYIPRQYGIRIENMTVVREVEGNQNFLQFETISLAPIGYNCIDNNLLTDDERKWLFLYHKKLYSRLRPFLQKNEIDYLKEHVKFYENLVKY